MLFVVAADVLREPLPMLAMLVGAVAGGPGRRSRWCGDLPPRLLRVRRR